MDLKNLGIDPNRGGCAVVVSGQLIKNEPWSMTDKESGEYREGYSLNIAYFGGVYKVQTTDGDPLRKLQVGTSIDLLVPVANNGNGLRQSGPATLLNADKQKAGAA